MINQQRARVQKENKRLWRDLSLFFTPFLYLLCSCWFIYRFEKMRQWGKCIRRSPHEGRHLNFCSRSLLFWRERGWEVFSREPNRKSTLRVVVYCIQKRHVFELGSTMISNWEPQYCPIRKALVHHGDFELETMGKITLELDTGHRYDHRAKFELETCQKPWAAIYR